MSAKNVKTCEFVSPKHPDKVCDFIADSILDAYLKKDPNSRTAIEVLGGHKLVNITGEISSTAKVDVESIVKNIIGPDYQININFAEQSLEIARGVVIGGAGDQGIMNGYATSETDNFMPLEYELARDLCQKIYEKYPYDGKVQVTLEDKKVKTAVASFQNTSTKELEEFVRTLIDSENYLINPAGEWHQGGFDADSGLSGRKIVIDNYGPEISVGGGSFSGKDATKVDRSAAYMARKIAVDLLRKYQARKVKVKLAYAIGKAEPLMKIAVVDGREMEIEGYDLTPQGIINLLDLKRPIFAKTAIWGHFGRGFRWDR
ncbi:MAG: S-adenosylmethionine synthase [Candidatus Wolfebacteria bacterium GW2011_GWC1_43_10]|uniref:methionine adenosyltransferase n=2 Tax=Candidatus Wolfeibacteriota TaxID=1752735 RepID=A0A0G1C9Q4_9BACT|nr:MAG: S-adenosylmethionine synthase [Candidatus Wolfebacteria bacterium GW2011_GWC1_43_10]OGM89746.1 MAG: hypothetical protein A2108_01270 [Candidatus Wolfebacteria bacterium GWA1_42_9]